VLFPLLLKCQVRRRERERQRGREGEREGGGEKEGREGNVRAGQDQDTK